MHNLQPTEILHDFIAYQKLHNVTDTNTSVNFTALSLSGMHSATASAHHENQVDAPRRQYGHHPIPKIIKVTYGSVSTPIAQGLVAIIKAKDQNV